jgi:hypothetical protein
MRAHWLLLFFGLGALGCSRMVYQPMSGLHRPIAIDTQLGNFVETAISLRCSSDKALGESDVRKTCRRLKRLFERQGAQVRISTSYDKPRQRDADDEVSAEDAPRRPGGVQLFIELKALQLHAQSALPFFWDGHADFTFAHEVVIRDETGFLLARDRLTGRFVRRMAWPWEDDDALPFSKDFYGQLSQLAFNARMRWIVTQPVAPPPAPAPERPARTPRRTEPAPKPKAEPTPAPEGVGGGIGPVLEATPIKAEPEGR